MGVAVGIDLGTTNTVVAAVRNGVPVTLADEGGRKLIPSFVAFHPSGKVLVGESAKDRRVVDPSNTIYSVKRLIGRTFVSDEVQRAIKAMPFEIVEGDKQGVRVMARGEMYTLPEISAFVLRRAKAVAEAALGETVDRAVITVPANFNDPQRAATKLAGKLAGLDVLRILNEPTAAALAYGQTAGKGERIAVYDLGGGTFDVTLLDLSGEVFEVLATGGDTSLGGDDIDQTIAAEMTNFFLQKFRFDPRPDPTARALLRSRAEKLKHALSEREESTIEMNDVVRGEGGAFLPASFTMDRRKLEALAGPLIERTIETCRFSIETIGVEISEVERVLLVGGSTRMPLVVRRVEEYFQRPVAGKVNPDEVVAQGAAVQAAALTKASTKAVIGKDKPKTSAAAMQFPEVIGPAPKAAVPTRPGKAPAPTAPVPRGGALPAPSAVVPPRKAAANAPLLGKAARIAPRPSADAASLDSPFGEADDWGDPFATAAPASLAAKPEQATPDIEAALREFVLEDELEVEAVPTPRRADVPAEVVAPPPSFDFDLDIVPAKAKPKAAAVANGGAVAKVAEEKRPIVPGRGAGPPPLTTIAAREPAVAPRSEPPEVLFDDPVEAGLPAPDARPTPRSFAPPGIPRRAAPLLIDVTPISLGVEVAGGFCDFLIRANTPVPCDRTRIFRTASDNQVAVRVRVVQGESQRFSENTYLGDLELSGLRAAARGEVQVAVTFEIDADGILNVRAKEEASGRETVARMNLLGAQTDTDEVAAMMARQRKHEVL